MLGLKVLRPSAARRAGVAVPSSSVLICSLLPASAPAAPILSRLLSVSSAPSASIGAVDGAAVAGNQAEGVSGFAGRPSASSPSLLVEHVPVMVSEVVEALVTPSGGQRRLFVDATAGHGGHSEAILRADPLARVVCIDADAEALRVAEERLAAFGEDRVAFFHGSYSQVGEALQFAARQFGSELKADGLLFDLGVGSHQLSDSSRGFSYRHNGPLDMRYDSSKRLLTAEEIVSSWSEASLRELLLSFGGSAAIDEAEASLIARAICAWRGDANPAKLGRRITSTLELRFAVETALDAAASSSSSSSSSSAGEPKAALEVKALRWGRAGKRPNTQRRRERDLELMASRRSRHPAALRALFQALRIAVNGELQTLADTLSSSLHRHLAPKGRVVALSFQPHEDEAVSAAFATLTTPGLCPAVNGAAALAVVSAPAVPSASASASATSCPCGSCGGAAFSLVASPSDGADAAPALRASEAEVRSNARARSARMRVLQRDCTCATTDTNISNESKWSPAVEDALKAVLAAVMPTAPAATARAVIKTAGSSASSERISCAPSTRSRGASSSSSSASSSLSFVNLALSSSSSSSAAAASAAAASAGRRAFSTSSFSRFSAAASSADAEVSAAAELLRESEEAAGLGSSFSSSSSSSSASSSASSGRRSSPLDPDFNWGSASGAGKNKEQRRVRPEDQGANANPSPTNTNSSLPGGVPPHPSAIFPLPPVRGSAPPTKLPPQRPGLSAGILEALDAVEDKAATLAAGKNIFAGKAAALNEGASAVPQFDPFAVIKGGGAASGNGGGNPIQAMSAGAVFGIDSLERVGEAVNFGVGKEGRMAIAGAVYRRLRQQKQRRQDTLKQILRNAIIEKAGVSRITGQRLTKDQADNLASYLLLGADAGAAAADSAAAAADSAAAAAANKARKAEQETGKKVTPRAVTPPNLDAVLAKTLKAARAPYLASAQQLLQGGESSGSGSGLSTAAVEQKASQPALVPTIPPPPAANVHGLKEAAATKVVPLKGAFENPDVMSAIRNGVRDAKKRQAQSLQAERWQSRQEQFQLERQERQDRRAAARASASSSSTSPAAAVEVDGEGKRDE